MFLLIDERLRLTYIEIKIYFIKSQILARKKRESKEEREKKRKNILLPYPT